MNKITKIIYVILGGCNIVMNLFIPIAVALLFIITLNVTDFQAVTLLIVSLGATIFNGIKRWTE
jgi:hypothetical protein